MKINQFFRILTLALVMIISTTESVFTQNKIALNGSTYKVSKDNVS